MGVAKGIGADDVFDGYVTWGSLHTRENAYFCNNSKSEKAAEQRLGAGPYRSSHCPTLVGRRSKKPRRLDYGIDWNIPVEDFC